MDISKTIAELKQRPDFTEKVGMILIHNGVVRAWSRQDGAAVDSLETEVDQERIAQLRQEYLAWPGIYEIIVETESGSFQPGDDLLFIIVAGDLREHVKPVLSELLDRIKAEAVRKKELAR
jgi:molybdopterin synthase catalytic subunit